MTRVASNEHAEKYCQCSCSLQQYRLVRGLMNGSFSLAIYHVMSIHSRKENMFMFRVLCVMELFNEGTVCCLLRNAVVNRNEFSIS